MKWSDVNKVQSDIIRKVDRWLECHPIESRSSEALPPSGYEGFDPTKYPFLAFLEGLANDLPGFALNMNSKRGHRVWEIALEDEDDDAVEWDTFDYVGREYSYLGIDARLLPCRACGVVATECAPSYDDSDDAVDPCLGVIADVEFACCGHGVTEAAYVRPTGRESTYGRAALEWFRQHGIGPRKTA